MYWNFYNERILFLERMIEQNPENKDFIQSYTKLIDKQIDWEIKCLEYNAKIHSNNTEYNKNHDNLQQGYAIQELKEHKNITKQTY